MSCMAAEVITKVRPFRKDGAKLFGSSENVCDLTLEEFLALRFIEAPQYRPHTLDEVLSSKVAPILFHIKEGGDYLKIILDYISRYHYEDKVFMGVQTSEDVKQVKEYNSQIKVLAFTQDDNTDQDFQDAGADIIRLWEDWVSKERIDRIKAQGGQVWVMAGSPIKRTEGYAQEEAVLKWMVMGVDGIIINDVAKTRKLLNGRRG